MSQNERAEAERLEGYLDGLDPESPEPSRNRSWSYRHGFICGRADKNKRPAFLSAKEVGLAPEAIEKIRLDFGYEIKTPPEVLRWSREIEEMCGKMRALKSEADKCASAIMQRLDQIEAEVGKLKA